MKRSKWQASRTNNASTRVAFNPKVVERYKDLTNRETTTSIKYTQAICRYRHGDMGALDFEAPEYVKKLGQINSKTILREDFSPSSNSRRKVKKKMLDLSYY